MEGGPKSLREQLEKWWGANATKEWRDSELAHEILLHAQKNEGQKTKARWFIGDKQVCRNFYLRVRGIHHKFVRKMEKQLLEHSNSICLHCSEIQNSEKRERECAKNGCKRLAVQLFQKVLKFVSSL